MSDKLPIDYARAESADVVRKKFRRRVVMFLIVTVVVMVIGAGWIGLWNERPRVIDDYSIRSKQGWVSVSRRKIAPGTISLGSPVYKSIGNSAIGVHATRYAGAGLSRWEVYIRYRTLFILAMIPWIITLIRMIRVWKQKRVMQVDGALS